MRRSAAAEGCTAGIWLLKGSLSMVPVLGFTPQLEPPPMQDLLRLSLCSRPRSKDGEMSPELRFPASCLISCCSWQLAHDDKLLLILLHTG